MKKPETITINWEEKGRTRLLEFLNNGTRLFYVKQLKSQTGFISIGSCLNSLLPIEERINNTRDGAFQKSVHSTNELKLGKTALQCYLAYILYFHFSELDSKKSELNFNFEKPEDFIDIILELVNPEERLDLLKDLFEAIQNALDFLNKKLDGKIYVNWSVQNKKGSLVFEKTELPGFKEFQKKLKEKTPPIENTSNGDVISNELIAGSQFTSQHSRWNTLKNWFRRTSYFVKGNLLNADKKNIVKNLKLYIQPQYNEGKAEYSDNRHLAISKKDEHLDNLLYSLVNNPEDNISSDFKYFYITGPAGVGKSLIAQRLLYLFRKKYFDRKKVFIVPYKMLLSHKDALIDIANDSDIVFIDSLDESEAYVDNPDETLKDLLRNLSNPQRIIISCRSPFLTMAEIDQVHTQLGTPSARNTRLWELKDFTKEEIDTYLKRLFRSNKESREKLLHFFGFLEDKGFDFLARQFFLEHVSVITASRKINLISPFKFGVLESVIEAYIQREINLKGVSDDEYLKKIYDTVCTKLAKENYLNPNSPNVLLSKLVPEGDDEKEYVKVIKRSFLNYSEKDEVSFPHRVWYDLWLAKYLINTEDYITECRFFNEEYWAKIAKGQNSEYTICLDFWKEMVVDAISNDPYHTAVKCTLENASEIEAKDLKPIDVLNVVGLSISSTLANGQKLHQYFKSIKEINLYDAEINLKSLASHKRLVQLRCTRSKTTSNLSETRLNVLHLDSCISELPLQDTYYTPSLTSLSVCNTDVSSFDFLHKCDSMETLRLEGGEHKIKINDLDFISSCPSIKDFTLTQQYLEEIDISPLEGLKNLDSLDLEIYSLDQIKSIERIVKNNPEIDLTLSLSRAIKEGFEILSEIRSNISILKIYSALRYDRDNPDYPGLDELFENRLLKVNVENIIGETNLRWFLLESFIKDIMVPHLWPGVLVKSQVGLTEINTFVIKPNDDLEFRTRKANGILIKELEFCDFYFEQYNMFDCFPLVEDVSMHSSSTTFLSNLSDDLPKLKTFQFYADLIKNEDLVILKRLNLDHLALVGTNLNVHSITLPTIIRTKKLSLHNFSSVNFTNFTDETEIQALYMYSVDHIIDWKSLSNLKNITLIVFSNMTIENDLMDCLESFTSLISVKFESCTYDSFSMRLGNKITTYNEWSVSYHGKQNKNTYIKSLDETFNLSEVEDDEELWQDKKTYSVFFD